MAVFEPLSILAIQNAIKDPNISIESIKSSINKDALALKKYNNSTADIKVQASDGDIVYLFKK